MRITIFQKFKNYKKDYLRYLVNDILNPLFIGFTVIYFIVLLIGFLNYMIELNFYPEIIHLLISSLGLGLLGMVIYNGFHVFKALIHLNREKETIYEGKVSLSFEIDEINLLFKEEIIRIDWKKFKELKVINGTAFFVPADKKNMMLRINNREIIDGNFEELIEFVSSNSKLKNN